VSKLLINPDLKSMRLHNITPSSAGWKYVGLEVYKAVKGNKFSRNGDSREVCVVLLSGEINFFLNGEEVGGFKGRSSVFDNEAPFAFYCPANHSFEINTLTDCEFAYCTAPGLTQDQEFRVIIPEKMEKEKRGEGSNTRYVCNILPETEPADSLLVVEVITPSGNWSSYPPHKHDQDNLPTESYLEETYYHRIDPSQGYVTQRVYTDDLSINESMSPSDKSVVLVPAGYHPVGVPHGYKSYYLNVMAGPKRVWKFKNDPNHDWIVNK